MVSPLSAWSFRALEPNPHITSTDLSPREVPDDQALLLNHNRKEAMSVDEDIGMAQIQDPASTKNLQQSVFSSTHFKSPSYQHRLEDEKLKCCRGQAITSRQDPLDDSSINDACQQFGDSPFSNINCHQMIFEQRSLAEGSTRELVPRDQVQPDVVSDNYENMNITFAKREVISTLHGHGTKKRDGDDLAYNQRLSKRHQSQPPLCSLQHRQIYDNSHSDARINRITQYSTEARSNQRVTPTLFLQDMPGSTNIGQQCISDDCERASASSNRYFPRGRQSSMPQISMRQNDDRRHESCTESQLRNELQRGLRSSFTYSQPKRPADYAHGHFQSPISRQSSPEEELGTLIKKSRPFQEVNIQRAMEYLHPERSIVYNERIRARHFSRKNDPIQPIQPNDVIDLTISSPETDKLTQISYRPLQPCISSRKRSSGLSKLSNSEDASYYSLKGRFDSTENSARDLRNNRKHPRMDSVICSFSSKTSRETNNNIEGRRQQLTADRIIERECDAKRTERDAALFGDRIDDHHTGAKSRHEVDRQLSLRQALEQEVVNIQKQDQEVGQRRPDLFNKRQEETVKKAGKDKLANEKAYRLLIKREAEKHVETALQVERRNRAIEKLQAEREKKISEVETKERDREQMKSFNKAIEDMGFWTDTFKSTLASMSAGGLIGAKRDAVSDPNESLFLADVRKNNGLWKSELEIPQNAMELLAKRMLRRDDARQAERVDQTKERQEAAKQGISNVTAPKVSSAVKLLDDVSKAHEQKRKQKEAALKAAERRAKERSYSAKRVARRVRNNKEQELRKGWLKNGVSADEAELQSLLDAHVVEYLKKREEKLRRKDLRSSIPASIHEGSFVPCADSSLTEAGAKSSIEKEQAVLQGDDSEWQAGGSKRDQVTDALTKARKESSMASNIANSGYDPVDSQTDSEISEEDPMDELPLPVTDLSPDDSATQPQNSSSDACATTRCPTLASDDVTGDQLISQAHTLEATKPLGKDHDEFVYLYMAIQTKVIDDKAQGEEALSERLLRRDEANEVARFYFDQLEREVPKTSKFTYQVSDDLFQAMITIDEQNFITIKVKRIPILTTAIDGYSSSLIEPRFSRKVYFVYLQTSFRKKPENEDEEPVIDNMDKCLEGQAWTDLNMANNEACKVFLDFTKTSAYNHHEDYQEIVGQVIGLRDEATKGGLAFSIEFEPNPDEMPWLATKGCQKFGVDVRELVIEGPIN